jgi:hypothetical protein
MQRLVEIDLHTGVLAHWRRFADFDERPGGGTWGPVLEKASWSTARIEPLDVPNLYVIGSGDWFDIFGSYNIERIGQRLSASGDDPYRHSSRIRDMAAALESGGELEPAIMVGPSIRGPFVALDGCHRLVARVSASRIVGERVLLGVTRRLRQEFPPYRNAVPEWSAPRIQSVTAD